MATDRLVDQLRDAFKRVRYGGDGPYIPEGDLFDMAADRIEELEGRRDRPTSELVRELVNAADEERDCAVEQDFWHQELLRKAATRITDLEATIARLQAAMREAASAAQVYLDEGSDPFDPSCDRLEASIATMKGCGNCCEGAVHMSKQPTPGSTRQPNAAPYAPNSTPPFRRR